MSIKKNKNYSRTCQIQFKLHLNEPKAIYARVEIQFHSNISFIFYINELAFSKTDTQKAE